MPAALGTTAGAMGGSQRDFVYASRAICAPDAAVSAALVVGLICLGPQRQKNTMAATTSSSNVLLCGHCHCYSELPDNNISIPTE
jgi:hypothetical protein